MTEPTRDSAADTEPSRILHPERIPPVLAVKVAELLAEALDLGDRCQSFGIRHRAVIATVEVLSYDEGLGIATSTDEPDAERLAVLDEETGLRTISAIADNAAAWLSEPEDAEPMVRLRSRLGLVAARGGC